MKWLTDRMQMIISICIFLGIIGGANHYFAYSKDLKLVALRLDQKIENDNYINMQQQLRELEKQEKESPSTKTEQDITELKDQIDMEKDTIKELRKSILKDK